MYGAASRPRTGTIYWTLMLVSVSQITWPPAGEKNLAPDRTAIGCMTFEGSTSRMGKANSKMGKTSIPIFHSRATNLFVT
jgi:hypothetical protein